MYPTREAALFELKQAGQLNPGPWTAHCLHAAQAAERIAARCGLNPDKAFVCGLLHDIGRRTGICATRHMLDGYAYMMEKGWDEVARICLTHSFPVQDAAANLGKKDITPEQDRFLTEYIRQVTYDAYDKLIILCDSLADANGFCLLEKRFVDTTRRYGVFPFTVERWNRTFAIKEEFEQHIGCSLYTLLPGIENCLYT